MTRDGEGRGRGRFLFSLLLVLAILSVLLAPPAGWAAPRDDSPSPYYTVETIKTPPGLSAEVGGLTFTPDGRLVACFHRGEVYTYDVAKQEWKLFAHGLHDPLGVIAANDAEFIVMQRPELTRLRDTDGDGVADSYETICDAFGMTGNYHEFAFGPLAAPDGGWFVSLNCASEGSGIHREVRGEYRASGREGRMYAATPYRGWVVKIAPDGKVTPWASGFRSPNGLGFDAKGRLFVPDNQGDWIGTSPLYHVEKGKFYGHPASLAWKTGEKREPLKIPVEELDKTRTRPSVLFPQNLLANSPTQPLADSTEGKFGPFAGQLLVGEMNHPRLMRVVFDEVDGQLNGMAVSLLNGRGLRKGNNRAVFAPDGSLWVGQTDHGWAGDTGIQRIAWTGKVPLEVKEMHLTKTGFELTFTRPLDAATAGMPESYGGSRYYYEYHQAYGSAQFDVQVIQPKTVTVAEDRTKVTLEYDPLVAWRVYQFNLKGLKAEDGEEIGNASVFYTLNHLLSGTPPPPPPGGVPEVKKEKGLPLEPKTVEKKTTEKKSEAMEKPAEKKPAEKPVDDKTKKPAAEAKPTEKTTAKKSTPTPTPAPTGKKSAKSTPTPKPTATPKKK